MSGSSSICGERQGIVSIDACNATDALRVLERGFPNLDTAFWQKGLVRWNSLVDARKNDLYLDGHIFQIFGKDVGVLLTFKSDRIRSDGTRYQMINLSSWYIDVAYRWRAPMMLRSVVRDERSVFTDLTPSPEVDRINVAVGFRDWSDGMLIAAAVPWAAKRSPNEVRLVELDDPRARDLGAQEREMLARHRAVGCLAAILCQPHGVAALLFRLIRRRGIVFAQLLYAESRRMVIEHLPAVMRFLLARGVLLLSIDATRAQCPSGTFFRPGRRRFCKGPIDPDRLDYACSELVAFGI
ncbi:hypothetical protein OCOJLMKI_1159 [Methylobacterium iners]|uniref:Uncharacterized protein n=2 Tax=Methylobacterium iners TaxID=418707 RepID=A0ABQ4RT57_9HYPH|nr:hypothetical protein OCOJLMKI_1159 [Methylobacterium iners]